MRAIKKIFWKIYDFYKGLYNLKHCKQTPFQINSNIGTKTDTAVVTGTRIYFNKINLNIIQISSSLPEYLLSV